MKRLRPIKRTTDLPSPCGAMPRLCHASGRNFSRSHRGLPSFDAGACRARPSRKFCVQPISQSRARLSRGFAAALNATALESVPFTWAWNAGRPGAVDTPPVASLARVCRVAKAYPITRCCPWLRRSPPTARIDRQLPSQSVAASARSKVRINFRAGDVSASVTLRRPSRGGASAVNAGGAGARGARA